MYNNEEKSKEYFNTLVGFPLVLFMILITLMSLLGLFSSNLYLLALPEMASYFNVSLSNMQVSIALYILGFALSQIIFGTLSDSFGRKIVMIYGVSLYVITSFLSLISTNLELMITFRFLQGIGAGSGMVIGRAILNDVYPKERVAQILTSMFPFIGSMPAFGPLIGGYLNFYFSWQTNFILFIVLGIIILLLLIFVLKETIKEKIKVSFNSLLSNYFQIFTTKLFLKYGLILFFTTGIYFMFLTDAVFMFKKHNASQSLTYFGYALIGISFIVGNLFAKVLLKWLKNIDKVMFAAIAIDGIAGILMIIFVLLNRIGIVELMLLASATSFANGILVPLAYTNSSSLFPKLLGSASGVAGLFQTIGASIGSAVIAYFYFYNIQILLALMPVAILLLVLLIISILVEKRKQALSAN